MKTIFKILSPEQLTELRESGYVVIHREPTESMLKAGMSTSEYHYGDWEKGYHRMVAESIRLQKAIYHKYKRK